MTIPEIDELVNWVKRNVLDMPKSGDDMAFGYADVGLNAELDSMADRTRLSGAGDDIRPSRAELVNVPTEYDYPLSLLEHILGLDRV